MSVSSQPEEDRYITTLPQTSFSRKPDDSDEKGQRHDNEVITLSEAETSVPDGTGDDVEEMPRSWYGITGNHNEAFTLPRESF